MIYVRCSAEQVSEAVLILGMRGLDPIVCKEFEEIEDLKCLDIFFSTLFVFYDAFSKEMYHTYDKFLAEPSLSKKTFIEYMKLRALLLTEKNGYFDFMLVCTYFSLVQSRRVDCNCFHLAGTACKLLTRILENRFGEIFETDSGWENMISYCRSIHSSVFPTKENRPPGYNPYSNPVYSQEFREEANENDQKTISIEELDENEVSEQRRLEIERDDKFIAELLGLIPPQEDSSDSSSQETDSSNSESLTDDTTYWNYFKMDNSTLCERITQSEAHLEDVSSLLKTLQQNIDATLISSNEYDISVSDDEYIEQLEKGDEDKTFFRDSMRKFYVAKICEEENERLGTTSGQDQVLPETITDDQIREYILETFVNDEPKCELCGDKMRPFMKKWNKSFYEKYSNTAIVTDLFELSEEE